jgi:hypothetical protein
MEYILTRLRELGHSTKSARRILAEARNNRPLRIEPERGKVAKDSSEAPNSNGPSVLHDDEAWSKYPNASGELGPETGLLTSNAGPLAGVADVLAGETSADDIDAPIIVRCRRKRANVVPPPDCRPVLRQHLPTEWVEFDLPRAGEAGTLEPEVEAPDAGEQTTESERHTEYLEIGFHCWNCTPPTEANQHQNPIYCRFDVPGVSTLKSE